MFIDNVVVVIDLHRFTLVFKILFRYRDGQYLEEEDMEFIKHKILIYHPNLEQKIGCGITAIRVWILISQKLIFLLDIWVFSLSFSSGIFIWRTDWTKFEVPENPVFCVGSKGWILGRFFLSQMLAKYHKLKHLQSYSCHIVSPIIWKNFVSITIISWLINIFTVSLVCTLVYCIKRLIPVSIYRL